MRPHLVAWLDGFLPYNIAALFAPSWFTAVGLAGAVTLLLMVALSRRHKVDAVAITSVVLWAYVAAVVAGIVVPIFIDAIQQKLSTGHVRLRWAGMTSFWGYLAGFVAVVVVCRDHKLSLGRLGDLAAAPLGLALMFSRIGCFLGGCDYGKVSSVAWAVRFPKGSPAWQDHVNAGLVPATRAESLPVHPTQLYEAMLGILIAVVALWASRQDWAKEKAGRVVTLAIAMYATGRIGVETLRADVGRGIYGGLSSGQIFSICVLAAIAISWLARRRVAQPILAAAAALVLVMATGVDDAHAQPTQAPAPAPAPLPPPQQPQQPSPEQQQPQQQQPQQGYPQQQPSPQQQQQPYPQPYPESPQQAQGTPSDRHLEIGLLGGLAVPLNRRHDQVPALAGLTVSAAYRFGHAGIWLDFDSLGNRDASHGTFLVSGSIQGDVGEKLSVGGRIGFGATLVNFEDNAFQDVAGSSFRFEATMDYPISDSFALWARPLSFDILNAPELGGPITTWQIRIGVAYRLGQKSKGGAAEMPEPQTQPGVPPQQPSPQQPYPPQPYPPQPYPQQPAPAAPTETP